MASKYRTNVECKVAKDGTANARISGTGEDLVRLAEELFDAVTENMTREECAALWRAKIVDLLNAFHLDEEAAEMERRLKEEDERNAESLKS